MWASLHRIGKPITHIPHRFYTKKWKGNTLNSLISSSHTWTLIKTFMEISLSLHRVNYKTIQHFSHKLPLRMTITISFTRTARLVLCRKKQKYVQVQHGLLAPYFHCTDSVTCNVRGQTLLDISARTIWILIFIPHKQHNYYLQVSWILFPVVCLYIVSYLLMNLPFNLKILQRSVNMIRCKI